MDARFKVLFEKNQKYFVNVGYVWFYKSEVFKSFDKGKSHPKLIFEKKSDILTMLPGTSNKSSKSIKIPSGEYWKNSTKDFTFFVYGMRRNVTVSDLIEKGNYKGGGTKKILELIYEFKKKHNL